MEDLGGRNLRLLELCALLVALPFLYFLVAEDTLGIEFVLQHTTLLFLGSVLWELIRYWGLHGEEEDDDEEEWEGEEEEQEEEEEVEEEDHVQRLGGHRRQLFDFAPTP